MLHGVSFSLPSCGFSAPAAVFAPITSKSANGQVKKKEEKSESELTASVLKKDPKHRRLKEHLLIGRNRIKCASFQGSPLFQAM